MKGFQRLFAREFFRFFLPLMSNDEQRIKKRINDYGLHDARGL